MTKTETLQAERQEHIAKLRDWFPKGSTVYTVLRHVSDSGMSRQISVVAILGKDDVRHPNYSAHKALGYHLKNGFNDSLTVKGCGMDMGFEVAYNLAYALYGDGYALKHSWL